MIRQAADRRGPFKDGGATSMGPNLPIVAPVEVESERFLREKVAQIVSLLHSTTPWDRRIQALQQLEGLVKGGAYQYDAFHELLRDLREPLTQQLSDRRSAVSRTVCQALGVLACAHGKSFEAYAVHFIPQLFKVLAISVQVMAHAADECIRTIVTNCHGARILPIICSTICEDRNAKLRRCSCDYLLLVLQQWELAEYERCAGSLETAIASAAQDALSDIRSLARSLFASFRLSMPLRANVLLSNLDQKTREKLQCGAPVISQGIAGGYSNPFAVPRTPREEVVKHSHAKSRKSIGGAALRIALRGEADQQQTLQEPAVQGSNKKADVTLSATPRLKSSRVQHTLHTPGPSSVDHHLEKRHKGQILGEATSSTASSIGEVGGTHYQQLRQLDLPVEEPMHRAWRVLADAVPEINLRNEAATSSLGWRAAREAVFSPADISDGPHNSLGLPSRIERLSSGSNGPQRPLSEVLRILDTSGTDWKERAEALLELQSLIGIGDGATQALLMHQEKLVDILFCHLREAHVKVATACLSLIAHIFLHQPSILKPRLDQCLAHVFARACESNASIRGGASEVLALVPSTYDLSTVVSSLAASLDRVRAPRMQCAVLELFTTGVVQRCHDDLTDEECHSLRMFLLYVLPYTLDKHHDVRRTSGAAVQAIHTHDANLLVSVLTESAPAKQEVYCKALEVAVPGITLSLANALRSQGLSFYHLPHHGNASTSDKILNPSEALQGETLTATLLADVSGQPPEVVLAYNRGLVVDEGQTEPFIQQSKTPLQSGVLARRDQGPRNGCSTFTSPSEEGIGRRHYSGTGTSTPVPPNLDSDDDLTGSDGHSAPGTRRTASPSYIRPRTPNPFSPGSAFSPPISAPQPFQSPKYARQRSAENFSPLSPGVGQETHSKNKTKASSPFRSPIALPVQRLLADISNISLQENSQLGSPPRDIQPKSAEPQTIPRGACSAAPSDIVSQSPAPELDSLISHAMRGNPTALRSLACASLQLSTARFEGMLPSISAAILLAMEHVDWAAREASTGALRDLCAAYAHKMQALVPRLIPALVAACSDRIREVRLVAEEAAQELLSRTPLQTSLTTLAKGLPTEDCAASSGSDGPLIASNIKMIRQALEGITSDDAFSIAQQLLPGLLYAFNHPSADVRKGVVACLVDLWMVLGSRFDPLLEPLSSSQLKLVTIYLQRRRMA